MRRLHVQPHLADFGQSIGVHAKAFADAPTRSEGETTFG